MKKVAFTQRVEVVETYHERRDCADQRIADFLNICGYLPIPLPNDKTVAKRIIKECQIDGIVLTGGNSLIKYGGNAPERDDVDRILIEMAINARIPLYGFCRGMQSILDYYGCCLVDIKGHVAIKHAIKGKTVNRVVNSYHNQGCIDISSGELEVLAKSDDDIIEMIQHKSLPVLGTMWHPERENPYEVSDIQMLQGLFA